MLDKTIIVFYINIGNSSHEEVSSIMDSIRNMIKPDKQDENNVIHYIIPVRDQETRVECINAPLLVTSESMKEDVMKKIRAVDKKLDRITSYINANAEIRKVIIEKK